MICLFKQFFFKRNLFLTDGALICSSVLRLEKLFFQQIFTF